jgi:hypothetical protein
MAEDQELAAIVARPPSHPTETILLGVSILGCILAISLVWTELFGSYLIGDKMGSMADFKLSKKIAEKNLKDHYWRDFPPPANKKRADVNLKDEVEKDLNLTSVLGEVPFKGQ